MATPAVKKGIAMNPEAGTNESSGVFPRYVESDGADGFRMLYEARQYTGSGSAARVMKYAENPSGDGKTWVNKQTLSGPTSLTGVGKKNGGGYFGLHNDDAVCGAGTNAMQLWEAADLDGTWTMTDADVIACSAYFAEIHGVANDGTDSYIGAIGSYLIFTRPEYTVDGVFWRTLKKTTSADLLSWTPNYVTQPTSEMTWDESWGLRQFYTSCPMLESTTLYNAVSVYTHDAADEGNANSDAVGDEQCVEVLLASSTDYGSTWSWEMDKRPLIPRGPVGSWDGGQIYAWCATKVGSDWWIWYSGYEQRHVTTGGSIITDDQPARMGLAIWTP